MQETTIDAILGEKVKLYQPKQGYRAAIDPIFLSAFAKIKQGDLVLDVGTGIGTALLCLAFRCKAFKGIGLEIQKDLVSLAKQNVVLNHFESILEIFEGSVQEKSAFSDKFDHIITNPPYFESDSVVPSPVQQKSLSNAYHNTNLEEWISFCFKMLRAKGSLTMIYPVERLSAVLKCLDGNFGDIILYPLWPKVFKPAKRILITARKGMKGATQLLPGLILHEADGAYTAIANSILREGAGIDY